MEGSLDRRVIGAWAVGLVCGVAIVLLGGSEYRSPSPPDGMGLDQFTALAQERGWSPVWLPEGCGQGRPCLTLMYRRPRALFFMGPL
jgi:hypothetical protein